MLNINYGPKCLDQSELQENNQLISSSDEQQHGAINNYDQLFLLFITIQKISLDTCKST